MAKRRSKEPTGKLMTLKDVAEYLQVAERTVYLWAQSGQIPSFKLGNVWRFKPADLEEWFEECRRETPRKLDNGDQ